MGLLRRRAAADILHLPTNQPIHSVEYGRMVRPMELHQTHLSAEASGAEKNAGGNYDGNYTALSANIAKKGVRTPLDVYRPSPGAPLQLVGGHHRLAAAAAAGHTTIPARLTTPEHFERVDSISRLARALNPRQFQGGWGQ